MKKSETTEEIMLPTESTAHFREEKTCKTKSKGGIQHYKWGKSLSLEHCTLLPCRGSSFADGQRDCSGWQAILSIPKIIALV